MSQDVGETQATSAVSLRSLAWLSVAGLVLAAFPFLVRGPRGFDRFVFSVGVAFVMTAALAVLFPEVRRPPKPRFVFRSRGRAVAFAALSIILFVSIPVAVAVIRAQGWWR